MGKSDTASSSSESNLEDTDPGSEKSNKEEYQVIRPTKIESLLREQTDLQVSPEADDAMVEALNEIADTMASEAIKMAERGSEGSTVQADHVETAYSQIKKPHNSLYRAINQLDEARDQVKAAAEGSPFSDKKIND